ncbi:MAG: DNA translocase FtsK 4TM domain-containing protein [Helicobacteraceae bacterium]|nr:DNA translocase FtsK 4TM domain-containing protein [Helicobacteraceae bacterium]
MIYVSIALYAGSSAKVGIYGAQFADLLLRLFGKAIYAAPPVLFILTFFAYRYPCSKRQLIEVLTAHALFVFAIAIFWSLIFEEGAIGNALCEVMRPIIGSVGVGIFGFFLLLNGWLLTFRITMIGALSFVARRLHLVSHWDTFKEAAQESFGDMLIRQKNSKPIDDDYLPPVDKKHNGASAYEIDSYLLKKQEELRSFDESGGEAEPSQQQRLATLQANARSSDESVKAQQQNHNPKSPPIIKELEENRRLLDQMEKGERAKPKDFILPPLDFLAQSSNKPSEINESEIDAKIADLLEKLRMFKIDGDVVRTYTGPVVTTFEFKPAAHVKVSRITSLENDIAMSLRAQTIRIQAPIPGKDVVGIEIPNKTYETIYLREVLCAPIFANAASELTIALGKDIVGNPFVTDLKKLPHLLIAGTTGSGKSVGINAMILSLLYRNSPDSLRLLMIDPKMLEFSIYNDIPHLLTPVITKPKQAIAALANMVGEMERRYEMMSKTKTKNIESYNQKAREEKFEMLPFIVVVIDELADLMMNGGKEVEVSIARLAQMARASGIHLIVATQRPSVDVITGLIKANLPSRISYRVGSKIDSKVILDTQGAESLLGRGDMLFTPPGSIGLVRLHAPFSTEKEIERIVDFIKAQRAPEYDNSFLAEGGDLNGSVSGEFDPNEPLDEMFEEAKQIVLAERKSSISYIQRRLQIGYNRAARIIEQLEKMGVLSEQNSKGQREIL